MRDKSTAVYLIGRVGGPWKIGVAAHPFMRMAELQTGCPFELKMYGFCYFPSRGMALDIERELHNLLRACRAYGEWFNVEPAPVFATVQAIADRLPQEAA